MDLLNKLIEEQRSSGASDRVFARRLGVSQPLWTTTRRGKVAIGSKILAATAREFPQFGRAILAYLEYLARSERDDGQEQEQGCSVDRQRCGSVAIKVRGKERNGDGDE